MQCETTASCERPARFILVRLPSFFQKSGTFPLHDSTRYLSRPEGATSPHTITELACNYRKVERRTYRVEMQRAAMVALLAARPVWSAVSCQQYQSTSGQNGYCQGSLIQGSASTSFCIANCPGGTTFFAVWSGSYCRCCGSTPHAVSPHNQ